MWTKHAHTFSYIPTSSACCSEILFLKHKIVQVMYLALCYIPTSSACCSEIYKILDYQNQILSYIPTSSACCSEIKLLIQLKAVTAMLHPYFQRVLLCNRYYSYWNDVTFRLHPYFQRMLLWNDIISFDASELIELHPYFQRMLLWNAYYFLRSDSKHNVTSLLPAHVALKLLCLQL